MKKNVLIVSIIMVIGILQGCSYDESIEEAQGIEITDSKNTSSKNFIGGAAVIIGGDFIGDDSESDQDGEGSNTNDTCSNSDTYIITYVSDITEQEKVLIRQEFRSNFAALCRITPSVDCPNVEFWRVFTNTSSTPIDTSGIKVTTTTTRDPDDPDSNGPLGEEEAPIEIEIIFSGNSTVNEVLATIVLADNVINTCQ